MRKAHGILAGLLLLFIAGHAVMAGAWKVWHIPSNLAFLVWAGVVAIAVHILLSIGTTWQMMTDKEKPPSSKKKRHQVLKWVTGVLVLVLAVVHIYVGGPTRIPTAIAIACVLAWHACTGAKSLLKDLSIDRKWRNPLRVAICIVMAIAAVLIMIGM